jgi:hypothetical protein
MISLEKALAWLNREKDAKTAAKNRLLGEDCFPVMEGSGHMDEPSEEVLIELLRYKNLAAEKREAIISACEYIYDLLTEQKPVSDKTGLEGVCVGLCRLVDCAAPPELQGSAYSFFEDVLHDPKMPEVFLVPAVWARSAYKQTKEDIPLWEMVMEKYPSATAYAFNTLLKIDAAAPKIKDYLQFIWTKQAQENWPVDTAFLMRRAARRYGNDIISRTLDPLKGTDSWKKIESELQSRE